MTAYFKIRCWLLFIAATFVSPIWAQSDPASAPTRPASPSLLDSLIAIVIILFILSVIVEKITQLIRKYSPFIKPRHQNLRKMPMATVWRNIGEKQTGDNKEQDKRIEREVNSLSFMISLAITLAFRVDLFKMFTVSDPRTVLFWSSDITYGNFEKVVFALSIALTAFFLTFGSKFFHDLLDMLFQVKNLKRKMADENTYKGETIEQFDEYIQRSYSDLIETAIQQNREILRCADMTGPPMHGKMMKDGRLVDSIDIHVSGSSRSNIPSAVQAKLEKGQIISVPVQVIFDVEKPKAQLRQGDAVANASSPQFKGTICCKVRRNEDSKIALLTCSHVMTNGSSKNFFGTIANQQPAVIDNGASGAFFWALCDNRFDIALVDPGSAEFDYVIKPGKERAVTTTDMQSAQVKVVRQRGRGIAEGKIVNYRASALIPIDYEDGEFSMANLMLLSTVSIIEGDLVFKALTEPGDSGACVYDSENRPIGMIVAGNRKFSYAIPIADILVKANATIIS